MEFKVTEEEAREMARFEAETNCDISAGPDWGIHLDKVIELALHQVNPSQLVDLVHGQLGNVLSIEEVEDLVANFQAQAQAKVAAKLSPRQST